MDGTRAGPGAVRHIVYAAALPGRVVWRRERSAGLGPASRVGRVVAVCFDVGSVVVG